MSGGQNNNTINNNGYYYYTYYHHNPFKEADSPDNLIIEEVEEKGEGGAPKQQQRLFAATMVKLIQYMTGECFAGNSFRISIICINILLPLHSIYSPILYYRVANILLYSSDTPLIYMFFHFYRFFCSPSRLMSLLIARYRIIT